ncbi:hypothetical protein ACODT4_44605 [Streptomyces sp. 2.9]|uniref:hypothetical protein n=1 Tax=Streptomyces tritrimontium TaxID=3406573 RepID=UPI003BB7DC04
MPFLASAAGTAVAAAAMVVSSRTSLLFDSPVLAVLIWVAAGLLGFAAAWAVFRRRRAFRDPLTPRIAVIALVVAAASVWGVQALAAQVLPSPWARYVDELGGPGRCLAGTPYGKETAAVITMPRRGEGRMEIWPGEAPGKVRGSGVLRLDNAVRGGIHPLAAADDASKAILRTYGCR